MSVECSPDVVAVVMFGLRAIIGELFLWLLSSGSWAALAVIMMFLRSEIPPPSNNDNDPP